MSEQPIHVVLPAGALGGSDDEDTLTKGLRLLAVLVASKNKGGWPEKYGTAFENDTFMLHPYCWCEKEDCPWCGGCTCSDPHYFVDDQEVSAEAYREVFYDIPSYKPLQEAYANGKGYARLQKQFEKEIAIRNKRCRMHYGQPCDYCQGTGIFGEHGATPGMGAPNFWHKPSGLKVWWYKYIGRDMDVVGLPATNEEIEAILEDCRNSIQKEDSRVFPERR